jgi:hypothetical protein
LGFLFNLVFWMITFIILVLFLFYKPAETLIFIVVFVLICVIGAVLLNKYNDKNN